MATSTGGLIRGGVSKLGNKPATPTPQNWLAPMSNGQLVKQATNTISTAYAPQYGDLSKQSKQAQGVYAKRVADNKYYQSWLDTQMGALQAHADTTNAALNTMEQGLTDDQKNLYSAQPGSLVGAANARMGNVSNNSQSLAFNRDLTANQQATSGLLNTAEQQYVGDEKVGNSQLAGAAANNFATVQAIQTKELDQLNTSLTGIANARTKLGSSKTADIAKEIARLQGIEIQKAQNDRSYTAAAQALGLKAADTASLIANRAAGTKIAQQNANTSATNAQISLSRAQQTSMNQDRTFQLNKSKYDSATAKDLYERQHHLGVYKNPSHALTQTSQNTIYGHIDKLTGELNHLQSLGYTLEQATNILANGGSVKVGQHTVTPTSGTPYKTGGTSFSFTAVGAGDPLLQAAQAIANGGTGLTPALIQLLKAQGLSTPGKRYKARSYSANPGAHNAGQGAVQGIGSVAGGK